MFPALGATTFCYVFLLLFLQINPHLLLPHLTVRLSTVQYCKYPFNYILVRLVFVYVSNNRGEFSGSTSLTYVSLLIPYCLLRTCAFISKTRHLGFRKPPQTSPDLVDDRYILAGDFLTFSSCRNNSGPPAPPQFAGRPFLPLFLTPLP